MDTEELGDLVRERGAFTTVHFSPKLVKEILKQTDNKGVKVVYDAAGEPMMEIIGGWYVFFISVTSWKYSKFFSVWQSVVKHFMLHHFFIKPYQHQFPTLFLL